MALLDDTGGADLALSLSRYLSTAFDGSAVVRLREDNTDTEQDFKLNGSNVLVTDDVNEDTVATWLTNNSAGTPAFVTDWYDQSGNGRDYQQNTLADQPKLDESGTTNSLAAVRFERVAKYFLTSVASYQVFPVNGLFVAVVEHRFTLLTIAATFWGDPNSSTLLVGTQSDEEFRFLADFNIVIKGGTAVLDTDDVVVFESGASNPSDHIIRQNGTTVAGPTSLLMDARAGTHVISAATAAGSALTDQNIAELIQINGTKTSAQRGDIESSMGTQFNITVESPSTSEVLQVFPPAKAGAQGGARGVMGPDV